MAEDMGTWYARWRGGPALLANMLNAVSRAAAREPGRDVWLRLRDGLEAAQYQPDQQAPMPVHQHIDLNGAGWAGGAAAAIWAAAKAAAAGGLSTFLTLDGQAKVAIVPVTSEVRTSASVSPETVHSYLGRLAGELTDSGAPETVIRRVAQAGQAIAAWQAEQDNPALIAELAGARAIEAAAPDGDRQALMAACIASLHDVIFELAGAVHALQEEDHPEDAEGNEAFRAMLADTFGRASAALGYEFQGRMHHG